METRRITFNIKQYLEDLTETIETNPEMIDDEVNRFKEFLGRTDKVVIEKIITYVVLSPLVTENKRLRSFIMPCFN